MKKLVAVLCGIVLALAGRAWAQLSAPNAAGVSMGHLHYHVKDVEGNRGSDRARRHRPQRGDGGMKLPGVTIFLTRVRVGGTAGRSSITSRQGAVVCQGR